MLLQRRRRRLEGERREARLRRSQGFPNAKVQDRDEFKKNQASFLGNILNILYVLLSRCP